LWGYLRGRSKLDDKDSQSIGYHERSLISRD
jgi:hypothetical protein